MDHMLFESHLNKNQNMPFIFRDHICLPHDRYVANWHKNLEILYFLKGSGHVLCDLIETKVTEGDFFIVNSCCLHLVECDTCGLTYQCLIVDRDFCLANDIDTDNLIFQEKIKDMTLRKQFCGIIEELREKKDFMRAGIWHHYRVL